MPIPLTSNRLFAFAAASLIACGGGGAGGGDGKGDAGSGHADGGSTPVDSGPVTAADASTDAATDGRPPLATDSGPAQDPACASAQPWAIGVSYTPGDEVTNNGGLYRCLQANTSLATWAPSTTPSLWTYIESCVTASNDAAVVGSDASSDSGAPVIVVDSGPIVVNGSLPKHVLTGYWQDFAGNGATALKLADVPATYGLIAVAFANADSTPGEISFSLDPGLSSALGGYTDTQFKADIQTLHSQGRKVILSVGGQNGAIVVNDAASATAFANSAYSILKQYGFDGIDIDLENGITPSFMASALHQLGSAAGSGLIVTLAPQTIDMQSTSSAYFQLALSISDILTIVNMQFYNSGSMLGADGKVYSEGTVDFLTALADIQLKGGLRADQVGLGLPASTSGAGSGYVSPSVVNNALDCLARGANCGAYVPAATYPAIRGAMNWDINWDALAGYAFANTVVPHFTSLP